MSNAFIATGGQRLSIIEHVRLNPSPTAPTTFSWGTTTSWNVTMRVSEQRWPEVLAASTERQYSPMLISFLPGETPGVSASTMKPVKPLAPADGSVAARTN